MAIIELEYDSIQTIAYRHLVKLDTDLWERLTGEKFDLDNVTIEDIQEFVGWDGIAETGGDVLGERYENLEKI